MVNLRSIIAQVHRSIGSRRNFCSSAPPVTSSKTSSSSEREVSTFFGQGLVTGFAGSLAFLLLKDYKDNPTPSQNWGHHEKVQVPEVKEEIEAMKKRQSLLQEEIETMKKLQLEKDTQIQQFLMEKKNSG